MSASGDGWVCAEDAAVVTCELGQALAPGESAGDITLVATVEPGAYPSVANTASVTSETPDPDTSDNSSTTTLTVPPLVDLAVTKSHTGGLTVGTDATWTLTVTNNGPTDDPGPVTVVDTVPDGLRPLAGTGDGWSCAVAGQVVTCTDDTGLAVGDTATITLTTAVLPAAYPSVVNTATVTSPAEDTDPENNAATDTAPVEGLSALVVDKELTAQSDGRATFRIIVTNEGPNDTTAPIVVTDPLPEGMTPLSASGPRLVVRHRGVDRHLPVPRHRRGRRLHHPADRRGRRHGRAGHGPGQRRHGRRRPAEPLPHLRRRRRRLPRGAHRRPRPHRIRPPAPAPGVARAAGLGAVLVGVGRASRTSRS